MQREGRGQAGAAAAGADLGEDVQRIGRGGLRLGMESMRRVLVGELVVHARVAAAAEAEKKRQGLQVAHRPLADDAV